ncbi:MAG TPA: hypothetical protein VEF71_08790 [Streptosporangiaceae bacterium]|nr:hypothetical protein [Streptosporangiaceae bacterium]
MRALRRPRSTWLGRWLRGWRPDHNPLRRRSDRVETAALCMLLAGFLAGAPFVAHAAARWTYVTSAREAHAQQAALREVPATLLQAAQPIGVYNAEANARWRAPDGHMVTGQVPVPIDAAAGSIVMVWTNQAGQLTASPLNASQVGSRAELAEVLAVAGLAVVLIVTGWLVHWALNLRRLAAWEAEWLANGPRWSQRR